jgi:membrane protein YdbS with pleckstrin-like domain
VPLPRRFLNEDEEFLVELRPHWVFFAGPLFVAALAVAVVIAILVAAPSIPNWAADTLWALAAIPVLWLVGRLLRWRGYTLALTTTRILLRRGVLDRDIVQIRLQRITEINLSQKLWERALSTGRLIVDVQGEDDAVVLEFVRKPAIVQRVINGQINELVGGGNAEPIPAELRQIDSRSNRSRTRQGEPASEPEFESESGFDSEPEPEPASKTPPFGVPVVSAQERTVVYPAPNSAVPNSAVPDPPVPPAATAPTAPVATGPTPSHGSGPSEIRDRLIELDDLRQRGIISQEEFAAKKAELLSRI